jgi:hypothetical protein
VTADTIKRNSALVERVRRSSPSSSTDQVSSAFQIGSLLPVIVPNSPLRLCLLFCCLFLCLRTHVLPGWPTSPRGSAPALGQPEGPPVHPRPPVRCVCVCLSVCLSVCLYRSLALRVSLCVSLSEHLRRSFPRAGFQRAPERGANAGQTMLVSTMLVRVHAPSNASETRAE